MIEVQDLVKIYGTNRAVDGISFKVDKGEIVGFLGPNGAGKSTTMKILTCFIAPDGGKASIAGHGVLDDSLAVRKRLGYLPENTPLYEDMGVIEFLAFIASIRNIPSKMRQSRIDEVVDRCGLRLVAGKTISQLSRGYRQRVGLAQALIHDPDILILDEPTSALDPSQIVEIRELIREIGKQKTILLSTHIMQEVTATCTRVIIISRGRIVAQGTPEELTTGGRRGRTIRALIHAKPSDITPLVKAMPGLISVECSDVAGEQGVALMLASFEKDVKDPAERIYALARERSWTLRELREDRSTLEEVFIRVTRTV